ncbi:hypothetical protein Prum_003250 [Phytohabitans rumicis]|uniref:Uncharacterized protein n=1 Tax=Phytohabitans rumicis TaxID=1076125 RepID=A0A6V8KNE4_9ACTN|nr:hypothetical protein Prum_003250 [Phytohabitans rumicis]
MVIPALVLAVAACGSEKGSDIPSANGGGATPTATASLSSKEREERTLKYVQCMREQGIDMPDPGAGGGMEFTDATAEKMKAASEACRQYMPAEGELQQQVSAEDLEQMRKLAQCMREKGIDKFPDPGPDGLSLAGTGLDPQDATFKAAEEACKDLRPKRPGSGS